MEDALTQIQAIATAALGAAPAGAAKAAGAAPVAGAAPNLDHLRAISTLATNGTADKIAVEDKELLLRLPPQTQGRSHTPPSLAIPEPSKHKPFSEIVGG